MTFTVKDVHDDVLASGRYGYFIRSDGKLGYEDENNALYTIDVTVRASGGTVPASKPVRETFRVELSEYDRNLLRSIAQSHTVLSPPTLPTPWTPWSPNQIVYSESGTQVNSTFDHQGERP